ncbi:hypothetical protein [Spartinivicinus poritis]|uniref:Solute-binding protein family 3/N-terminal domain-containing protein n=1 Tax=Spartinivicinus poritis TaxID=2994640 RepID=A0ABT5UHC9_9GAMM|nr:hypothetical protein [Spartinivicinus sp. A2-2]MDE1465805.1 hypothetical protein [Spartinivicinus sp. A2-2]
MLFTLLPWLHTFGEKTHVTIHVDDSYKPYSYEHKKQAEGVYIEVLKAVFNNMIDFKVTMVPIAWQRGKQIMAKGKGFGLAPVFFHGHDWPYLYPYSLHFYEEKILPVCQEHIRPKDRKVWPNNYVGLRINNVVGFDGWGGEKFRQFIEKGKIKYGEVRGIENIILMTGLGRADCFLAEESSFDAVYSSLVKSRQFDIGIRYSSLVKGPVIGLDPVYIGYSQIAIEQGKYPFHKKFMKNFDIELYKLKKSGSVANIMRKAFIEH